MGKEKERKILKSPNNIFWEALVITLFIFGLGILLGIFIEDSRATDINSQYLVSQINLLDLQTLSEIIKADSIDCNTAILENVNFGNKIYEDALQLERYETASQLKDNLLEQHRRYDLLRTLFWINSIELKDKCNGGFNTIIYLYNYQEDTKEEKQKQSVFSTYLQELTKTSDKNLVLIPIAIDLGLSSLDALTNKYNITQTTILINEDSQITEIEELSEIEDLLL